MRNESPNDSQGLGNSGRYALILSAINVHRLMPGLKSCVTSGDNFWLVDIYRPFKELKELIQRWSPDGIITEYIPGRTEPILNLNLPTVLFTSKTSGPGYTSVDIDNEAIGEMAAEHFIALGLRNFAFYGNNTPYSEERLEGYQNRLNKSGIHAEEWIENSGWSRQYIEHWHESDDSLIQWIESLPKPSGIFVAHDPMGRSLAEACAEKGIKVPESIAILGVNNDDLVCNLTNPPLSSIAIPWSQMGTLSHSKLKNLISSKLDKKGLESNNLPTSIMPPMSLIQRASSNRLAVEDKRLAMALRIIREEACAGLTVKELVQKLNISRRRLEQQFNSVLQRTPRDEIIRIRLDRAADLLQQSNRTMPDIAEACGFTTSTLFSKNFSRRFGCSPSTYKSKFRSS